MLHVALFAFTTLLFAVQFLTFLDVQGESDLTIHIKYAEEITSFRDGGAPHFLFALLLRTLAGIGVSYAAAAVIVLGACYGCMAVLIARELERRQTWLSPAMTFLLVPAILLASHIFLFTLPQQNMYLGYFAAVVYHNPTQQLGKLFGLWTYFLYAREFLEDRAPRALAVGMIGALCIVSAVAKPSFLVAFVPAAGCIAAADLIRGRWRGPLMALSGIALPSAAVLLWQAQVTYTGSGDPDVRFAPFLTFSARETLFKLPASLAFPLVVWAGAWREHALDGKMRFIILFTALALVATLGLVESGREMEGNFAWTGQTAVFLAYVECALFLATRAVPRPWRYPAWAVFGLHVVSGVIWYVATFTPERLNYL